MTNGVRYNPEARELCGKTPYRGEAFARMVAQRELTNGAAGRAGIKRLWPYRCDRCGTWHLTKRWSAAPAVTKDKLFFLPASKAKTA